MKRMTVAALALTLSLSVLVGCGDKDGGKDKKKSGKGGDVTVEDVMNMAFESDDVESAKMTFEANVDVTAEAEGTTADITAGLDLEAEVANVTDQDNMDVHFTMGVEYSAMGMSDSMEMEAYMDCEDGEATLYATEDGETWFTETEDMTEIFAEAMDEDLISKLEDACKDVYKDAELADDTEEVNGEECYVVTLDTTCAAFQPVLDVLMEESEEGAEAIEELDVDVEEVLDSIPVSMTMYVSVEDGYCLETDVDFSDVDVAAVVEACGASLEDAGIDSITINELSFVVTMSDINDTEVTVPDEVIENASGSSMGSVEPIDPAEPSDLMNSDGTLNLCDYESNVKYLVYPLNAFELQSEYSSDTYYAFKDDEYNYVSVITQYKPTFDEFRNGIENDFYADYDAEFEDLGFTVDGNDVFFVTESIWYDEESDTPINDYYVGFMDSEGYFYGVEGGLDKDGMEALFIEAFADYIEE